MREGKPPRTVTPEQGRFFTAMKCSRTGEEGDEFLEHQRGHEKKGEEKGQGGEHDGGKSLLLAPGDACIAIAGRRDH